MTVTLNRRRAMRSGLWLAAIVAAAIAQTAAGATELKVLLPQRRTAFQTNETIDVSIARRATDAPLQAGDLTLALTSKDGSKLSFAFSVPAAAPGADGAARRTEHFHLNGWLLRPGTYTLQTAADGATAGAELTVHSHVRKSSFRLVNWGRAEKPAQQLVQGEDSLGYNLYYGGVGNDDQAGFIRANVDFMSNCTMSGAHQMDLRMECDWSDPYVTRGGTMRVVRRAMFDRTRPNVQGVHFYDEPGLTWNKDPATGVSSPHGVPAQLASYQRAFGEPPIDYKKVDPSDPKQAAAWRDWAYWKLSFMDAAWKEAQFGVSRVRPDYLSLTQSQYGWSAFTDGYYFNVVRSLPITSGHGGYDDYGLDYFNPSYTLEMARARDQWKPNWYLPQWYSSTPADRFRLEQYLSFQTGVQGMITPPDCEPSINGGPRQGLVESNHLMQRLGTIFTTMPVTRPPVAMLYSMSQNIHTQTRDRSQTYAHAMPQGEHLPLTYLAGKMLHQQFLPVLDEDVLDGTVAGDHKVVIVTSVDYLDPRVVAGLEEFTAGGGRVLLTGDSTVQIKGAVKLAVTAHMPDQAKIDELSAAKKYDELGPYQTAGKYFEAAAPLAKALQAELEKSGIGPVFECDQPSIAATRQAAGDVEYLFAVNATPDPDARDAKGNPERNAIKPITAMIALADPEKATYDAVRGGAVPELKTEGKKPAGVFHFGAGEMRVFARTARQIGGVRAGTPVVVRELVVERQPLRVEISASVLDTDHRPLTGSIPLEIRLIDPLGVVRYDLYRATKLGQYQDDLQLAANDPPGKWTLSVREMLSATEDRVSFDYKPPVARTLAGATQRAVVFPDDVQRCFQFARTFHEVTIVVGKSAYNDAAAARLEASLQPWGVRCKRMDLAEASKARAITPGEAATWVGLVPGRAKAGSENSANVAGFAVEGPVILLGTPEDNPIIKFLASERFLPYAPTATEFPGPGRGMMAWQRDGVGKGQESIALVAYDAAGMAEAVGSLYEAVAGIEPLTRWAPPRSGVVVPAAAPGMVAEAKSAWTALLPDRVLTLVAGADGTITAMTHDGSVSTVDASGKIAASKPAAPGDLETARKLASTPVADAALAKGHARPDRMTKLTAAGSDGAAAVAYWGGTLRIADAAGTVKNEQQLPQDVTAMTWAGRTLIVGLADGRVIALTP